MRNHVGILQFLPVQILFKKIALRDDLLVLASNMNQAWLLAIDFNNTISKEERMGVALTCNVIVTCSKIALRIMLLLIVASLDPILRGLEVILGLGVTHP